MRRPDLASSLIASLCLALAACSAGSTTSGSSTDFQGGGGTSGSGSGGEGGSAGNGSGGSSKGGSGGAGQGGGGQAGSGTAGGAGSGVGGSGLAGAGQGGAGQAGAGQGGSVPGGNGGSEQAGSSGQAGSGLAGSGQAGSEQSGGQGGSSAGSGGSGGSGGSAGSGVGGSGISGSGGSTGGSAGSGGATPPECELGQTGQPQVYAHSPDTLYRLDPNTKALTTIGQPGCGTLIDLAVDKSGNIYATTFGSLVKLDKDTAKCTVIKDGDYPNSLSFVPAGTIYPDKEALVGYNGSTYVLIDPATGQVTNKGSLSGGYSSSGDIVSVIGGGTYLTVNGGDCADCLLRVDPVTGDLLENLGPVGKSEVYGLAYWAGIVYGFNSFGELFTYDIVTKQTTNVNIPNAPSGLVFYGAGSTTCAPVHKPLMAAASSYAPCLGGVGDGLSPAPRSARFADRQGAADEAGA